MFRSALALDLSLFAFNPAMLQCLGNKPKQSGELKKLLKVYEYTEAATETNFENICSFLPGAPFSGVFQKALCVYRTDTNFPEPLF